MAFRFSDFLINKSPKNPPPALHVLARLVPLKKVSLHAFAIEKP